MAQAKKHSVRQPVKSGAADVPVVMQMEALECGAACLAMILAFYGKWVPLEQVRVDCGVSRDGSNAANVMKAARNYGLEADAYRMEPEHFKEFEQYPCIIHWNFNHFVVLNGFKHGKAVINDPARGTVKLSMEEFDKAFTGVTLAFAPSPEFEPGGRPASVISFARNRLKGTKSAVIFTILTTIISYIFGIINPGMTKVFMDRLLTGKNPDWLYPFIALLSLFAVVQIVVSALNSVYTLKLNGKMALVGNTSYMWKILRMPMEFFSQRLTGDIMQRKATNASIAGTLVNTFAPLVLNVIMMLLYLFIMARSSLILTAVGIASVLISTVLARIISQKRINISRIQIRDAGKLASATLTGISMMETIKSTGAETGFFQKWAGYQASVNAQKVRYSRTDKYWGIIPDFLTTLTNYLVLFIGVWFTMRGRFTIGMVYIFQGLMNSFLSPASSLIGTSQTLQEMRTNMERVEDVMKYPIDENYREDSISEDVSYQKLSGRVSLQHVTFGYSRLAAPLIEDFNLEMDVGSRVALVGGSGCGKSTIAKLISGLYKPWSGEILFDGKRINEIERSVFTGSMAVVDQDIILFEDTISSNIKMWDESIEDFEVIMAARDAQIHDDIMARDGGYQYMLSEGGKDLSGGQRQRVEIARVLAEDPTILILDEATSALDARTEADVMQALRDRGITCVIVAHRLSTIRDCDEIIVLDKGKVVERGTHQELMAKGGRYVELVTDE